MKMGEQSLNSIGQFADDESDKTKKVTAASGSSWIVNFNNGNVNTNGKNASYPVRAVSATESVVYDIPFFSIYEASLECEKNKRSNKDYLRFSCTSSVILVKLWDDIRFGVWQPSLFSCFVVSHPVYREIFSADYSDTIVHHWISLRLEPIYEKRFVELGNVSKNCRKGEGSLSAVRAAENMVRTVSCNYTKDCYLVKIDFKGFFMNMSKSILWEMSDIYIRENYTGDDIECLLYLLRMVIFDCPEDHCVRKSPLSMWDNIPADKSLFNSDPDKGGPLGNLTTQINANFYASVFDYYIIVVLGIKDYIRFVDDCFFVVPTLEFARKLIPKMRTWLHEQLRITMHPKKIYIQHYSKGVQWVGAVVKPGRTYISNRTVGSLYNAIHRYNKIAEDGFAEQFAEKFVATMNSYFGLMRHFQSYNLRRKVSKLIAYEWWTYVYIEGHFYKFVLKNEYKPRKIIYKQIKKGNAKKYFTPLLCETD